MWGGEEEAGRRREGGAGRREGQEGGRWGGKWEGDGGSEAERASDRGSQEGDAVAANGNANQHWHSILFVQRQMARP